MPPLGRLHKLVICSVLSRKIKWTGTYESFWMAKIHAQSQRVTNIPS
jgi:hypothetical protein